GGLIWRVVPGELPGRRLRSAAVGRPDFAEHVVRSALRCRVWLLTQPQPVPDAVLPWIRQLGTPRAGVVEKLHVKLPCARLVAEVEVDALAARAADPR